MAALEQWPESGVPDNPGAWLMATAKNRAINHLRRAKLLERKHEQLGHELAARSDERRAATDPDVAFDEDVGDDVLRLVFIACHPILSTEARVALTLRLLGGLTADEIARAFIVSEATIAQRIVRAKRTLSDAAVAFELPPRAELGARLASVLEVVYLIFNEGYAATAGDDVLRPALCEDALRLGRMLAQLAPNEPEAHGLLALMELHVSRAVARVGPAGEPILLLEQNRARWDQGAIQRGIAALLRAGALTNAPGRYALQGRGHFGLPRACADTGGHGLGAHRRAVSRARRADAVTGRGAEPRGGCGHGRRTRCRPRADRRARVPPIAPGLPLVA